MRLRAKKLAGSAVAGAAGAQAEYRAANPGNQPERVDVRQHIGLAADNGGEHRRALCGWLANSRRAAAEWAGARGISGSALCAGADSTDAAA